MLCEVIYISCVYSYLGYIRTKNLMLCDLSQKHFMKMTQQIPYIFLCVSHRLPFFTKKIYTIHNVLALQVFDDQTTKKTWDFINTSF